MEQAYRRQVSLLLSVLPEVAKEENLALHGGTAINLFVRDMPRLSVDIDLTYIPIADRETSLANIRSALLRIKASVERAVKNATITDRTDIGKLLISSQGVVIKLEVNLVNRGSIVSPEPIALCARAQEEFDAFCEITVVPIGQLYGGKLCAALDRQHPRDLFDVKYLLENEGFSDDVKTGLLLAVLSSNRPIHEVLNPTKLDQRNTFENQFVGMTIEEFTYDEFEEARNTLIETINKDLTHEDREFILSVKRLAPKWDIYDFQAFPSVQWKIQNLQRLKETNDAKYNEQLRKLEKVLGNGQ
ncbi:MAG TPA: nucleotidyl transferase AbiEii/AbiGii toxin family protein [Pyrinomonadaceae bacterium]|nr:nucleotidyl transferase AbiEii/AbiGii toxin family protein [Pyrinomonadaceae bacterium]